MTVFLKLLNEFNQLNRTFNSAHSQSRVTVTGHISYSPETWEFCMQKLIPQIGSKFYDPPRKTTDPKNK